MYIALEAGIGIGALVCADIYDNITANFIYAFMLPALLAVVAMVLLIVWRKQKARTVLVEEVGEGELM